MVAGSGPLEEPMRHRAAQIWRETCPPGLSKSNRDASLLRSLRRSCFAVHGRETWGLVANEALACGRPIIVSDAVGCAPTSQPTGLWAAFPLGNYPQLSEAIAAVLDEPPPFEAIQRRSRAYSIDVACDGIISGLEFVRCSEPND